MIPTWSFEAKKAKPVFFRAWNDIDIYIEDTGIPTKKLFKELLSRCCAGKYRVAEVFPLGGRNAVIDACTNDQTPDGRPRVYIVDGDLDLINGTIPKLNRLFSLPVYCIENFLIDESAIIEILYEEHPSKEKDNLKKEMDFDGWLESVNEPLIDLFIDYALCKSIIPTRETVQYKIKNLVSSGDGSIDNSKVIRRCKDIEESLITSIGQDELLRRKLQLVSSLKIREIYNSKVIASGKHYLLPLLRIRMHLLVKFRVTNDSLNMRLAKYCDIKSLASLCTFCSSITVET